MEITETQKRKLAQKVPKLWNLLAPLQRSKIFHMKPTCLFVFHTWEELDKRQKDIVYNAVRVCIEQAIIHEEIAKFVEEIKRIGAKHLPHIFN